MLGISWRHIATAIGRRFIRDTSVTSQGLYNEVDDGDGDSDDEASDQEGLGEKDTIVKQTGHTAWTSGMVYGRGLQEANFETYQRRESFRQLNQEWHCLLGFPSALRAGKGPSPRYRPKLQEMGMLARRGVQRVYLTATLPVADEARFFHLINCSPEKATVFHSPTSRPNISYGVHTFDINDGSSSGQNIRATTLGAVRGLIDQKLGQYASSAKAIVYCQTKAATQALAEDLVCDAYYSDVSTADDKAERLRQWMEGVDRGLHQRGRVIVAPMHSGWVSIFLISG
ncbi:hypothetical protein NCS57_01481800 [Fusarium keratoplasticum]|uniref:Uncharacterized protein n=1 Tax=Fusarium keratoplasticum TaxID=1328300 RepID=A0ACC0QEF1_9HYPO|nr:hypothetical protein NCS57_01481800 [Fusarium keratoplasticum]KAI8648696.1 hypothetical protein NCS57_01481800 [Fusarium keratoplasticum]